MTPAPSSKPFCLLVWGLAILLPALLLGAILIPWASQLGSLDERIASSESQLARYRHLLASLPRLKETLERERSDQTYKANYFDARTLALAGAQLQSQIQGIVNTAKGRLVSTQILPQEQHESPPRIRVRTQIQGSTESLLEVLYQLELARPFLFVEQVSIRSSARQERDTEKRQARRPAANQAGELVIRLDVFGFVLGAGGA